MSEGISILQGLGAIAALLAAGAWLKSAMLQLRRGPSGFPDRWMDRISSNAGVWNGIAAVLSAVTAVIQALAFLFQV
jgi:hypothetical protein